MPNDADGRCLNELNPDIGEGAFSHNFRVTLVEEACAHLSPSAHRANLIDIDMKTGDVESIDLIVSELEQQFGNQGTPPVARAI